MSKLSGDIHTPEIGKVLRDVRLSKGLSEDEVATKLRINRQYIECMESGDLGSLPPEPYRKAFVKEYARFLGIKLEALQAPVVVEEKIDLRSAVSSITKEVAHTTIKTTEDVAKKIEENFKEAVDEIRSKDLWEEADIVRRERLGIKDPPAPLPDLSVRKLGTPPPEMPDSAPRSERRIPTQRLDLDRVVRKEAEEYQSSETNEDAEFPSGVSRSTKIVIGLLFVIAAVIIYSVISRRSENPVVSETKQEQAVKPEVLQKKVEPKPAAKSDSATVAIPAASGDSTLGFSITAKDSVWISVSPDIGGGFRGMLKAGETKKFSAKEKYIIYLGNQKAVSMELAGKALSGLPTVSGSSLVVRNVLLTKDKATALASTEPTSVKPPEPKPAVHHEVPPVKKSSTPAKRKPKTPTNEIHKTIPTTEPVLPHAD